MFKKIILIILAVLVFFSATAGALTPTPVYRIPAGQELEYISKLVQELDYLWELNEKSADIFSSSIDNSVLTSLMMGHTDLINVIANDDLHKMTEEELSHWVENDLMAIFEDSIILFEDVDEDLEEIRSQEAVIEVNYLMEEPVPAVAEMKKYASEDPEDKDITENRKDLIEKSKVVKENYERTKELYREIDKNYDQEQSRLDNSNVNDFINKQTDQLEKASDNFNDNADRITPALSYKMQVQLQMQNNAMMLQILKSMRDLNRQMMMINALLNKENLERELNTLKNQYHY